MLGVGREGDSSMQVRVHRGRLAGIRGEILCRIHLLE